VPVQLDVTLCCFTSVMHRVQMMTMRGMRMVSRRLVFAGAMMFGCFAMMFRGVFMMFSSLRVVFLQFLHWISLFSFGFSLSSGEILLRLIQIRLLLVQDSFMRQPWSL
jgi:hypothetical protein